METDDRKKAQGDELFGQLLAGGNRRAGRSTAVATLASVAFHAAIVAGAVWATLGFGRESIRDSEERVTFLEILDPVTEPISPPEPPIHKAQALPPPPEVVPPPSQPPVEDAEQKKIQEESQEDKGGFQTLVEPEDVPDELPASSGVTLDESDFSGEGVEGGRGGGALGAKGDVVPSLAEEPSLTPYTVAPVLLNPADVSRAMGKLYPRLLKRIGASGTVLLWILIDQDGSVLKSVIKKSSGREAFDHAALEVPQHMHFKPALNNDGPVAAWVVIPIEFKVR